MFCTIDGWFWQFGNHAFNFSLNFTFRNRFDLWNNSLYWITVSKKDTSISKQWGLKAYLKQWWANLEKRSKIEYFCQVTWNFTATKASKSVCKSGKSLTHLAVTPSVVLTNSLISNFLCSFNTSSYCPSQKKSATVVWLHLTSVTNEDLVPFGCGFARLNIIDRKWGWKKIKISVQLFWFFVCRNHRENNTYISTHKIWFDIKCSCVRCSVIQAQLKLCNIIKGVVLSWGIFLENQFEEK